LVCCIGATIGKMAIALEKCALNQQINAVEWGKEVEPHYGINVLQFFRRKIADDGASTTLPILKKSLFEKITVPTPPISLQRTFSARVVEIDKLKAHYRAHLAKLDVLFASLQHRAFRGAL
jgi:type I restriction enzyme S subunit